MTDTTNAKNKFIARVKMMSNDNGNDFQSWVENTLFTDDKPLDASFNEPLNEPLHWQDLDINVCSPSDDEEDNQDDNQTDDDNVSKLPKLEDEYNLLIAERECLSNQLQACEDKIEEIKNEKQTIYDKIDNSDNITSELLASLDEFSQATQMLLNLSEFYDIDDLISSYAKRFTNPEQIKNNIILDAKLHKKRMLLGNSNLNLISKNKDGLPKLYDSYITDSYKL